MDDAAKVVITRLLCGTAILIAGAVAKVDGTMSAISLFLLGVPVEYIQQLKKVNRVAAKTNAAHNTQEGSHKDSGSTTSGA